MKDPPQASEPSLEDAATDLFESTVGFFETFFNVKLTDLRFRCKLHKRIPSGGGLGGGSSDAALFFLFLRRHFLSSPIDITQSELSEIATCLGADIPFFLRRTHALIEGIGELVRPIERILPSEPFFLVFPQVHLSTKTVFDECRRHMSIFSSNDDPAIRLFDRELPLTWESLRELVYNDLLPYACTVSEKLSRCLERLQKLRSGYVTMTGSGSTLVVFPNSAQCSTTLLLKEIQTVLGEEQAAVCPVRFLHGWHQKE